MKNRIVCALLVAMAVASGCATKPELTKTGGIGTRSDVFQEVRDGGPIPHGYADLRIAMSLKTHNPGTHSSRDVHGTPDYRMLLNIDGQALQLQGTLSQENTEPAWLCDPEAGEGTRYRFEKRVRLAAGTHRVVIAIPADDTAVEREVTLKDGTSNSLVLEPDYRTTPSRQRPGSYGATSYREGIKGFWVTLNGKSL